MPSDNKPQAPKRGPIGTLSRVVTDVLAQILTLRKWLRYGLHLKRWLAVSLLGILILVAGVDLMLLLQLAELGDTLDALMYQAFGIGFRDPSPLRALSYQLSIGLPLSVLGLLVFLYGLRNTLTSLTSAVLPAAEEPIVDVIWRRRQLTQGARIVVIGGGTGLSTMLRGLKEYTSNITAIVTVTDDGGSSGRLQREFNMLPPGDIRNCLVALADAEPLMQDLFQYRFRDPSGGGESSGLSGHSFGNLLIAAMLGITGDFEDAVRETSRVLAIRGRVLPSTTSHVKLVAIMDDGTEVVGETSITSHGGRVKSMRLSDPTAEPLEETLQAIRTADAIIIGPGSVYTSVVPNFLVQRVADEVAGSPALRVYVCNVMTQPGETTGFSASDHVKALHEQAGRRVCDYALINVVEPSAEVRSRYDQVGSHWVLPDVEKVRALGVRPIPGDYIAEGNVVRHDPKKLAARITQLIARRDHSILRI